MAPENAKVFLAEDSNDYRDFAKRVIKDSSHRVIVETNTLEGALEAIPYAKTVGVNIAVLDGNLTEGDLSNRDGETLATALREAIPGIRIVSFSSTPQSYGDAHVSKRDPEQLDHLGDLITSL